MDVKPENIYMSSAGEYKIGDLGLISLANERSFDRIEEGDARYLCPELLAEDPHHLPKADVFSLGLSIYELALGRALPSSGEEWAAIREGNLTLPPNAYSEQFVSLIKLMITKDPETRPTTEDLLSHPLLMQKSFYHQPKDDPQQTISALQEQLEHYKARHAQLESVLQSHQQTQHELNHIQEKVNSIEQLLLQYFNSSNHSGNDTVNNNSKNANNGKCNIYSPSLFEQRVIRKLSRKLEKLIADSVVLN